MVKHSFSNELKIDMSNFKEKIRNSLERLHAYIINFVEQHLKKIFWSLCFVFFVNVALAGVILFPTDRGSLAVHFLDIGQGDAIFLRLPNEQDILIDGGPDKTILGQLGKVMPFYDREIDLVVLTHPHADHLVGLIEVLQNYQVGKIWLTGVTHTTDEYLTLLNLIKEKNIKIETPIRGEGFDFGEVKMEVLNPAKSVAGERVIESTEEHTGGLNDTSIVLRVTYKDNEFLFTGDITSELEKELVQAKVALNADVLKVAHHGSKFSSSREFAEAVRPRYAVIQVGRENRYGHPAWRVLRTLEKIGATVFRNDLNGNVKIVSDGEELRVKVEKQ